MDEQTTSKSGCLGHIRSLYSATAIIFLTTVIFILALDLVLGVAHTVYQNRGQIRQGGSHYYDSNIRRAALPYYQAQDWGQRFWADSIPDTRPHPYTIWRTQAYETEFMTFGTDGLRVTPGTQCQEDAYTIYILGGSTLWGEGSPDWGTIPAHMQAILNENNDMPICIHNFGQRAYHATQEVIELVNQLQLGKRPDLVIFYDGINEVGNTLENGQAWVHGGYVKLQAETSPLVEIAVESNMFRLLRWFDLINEDPFPPLSDDEVDKAITDTVNVYLENYRIVDALSQTFDFDYYFFWQPMLGASDKVLTPEEQDIFNVDIPDSSTGFFTDPLTVIQTVYRDIQEQADNFDNLYYIGDALDTYSQQIYIDIWHITPEGNEIIAQRILDIVDIRN